MGCSCKVAVALALLLVLVLGAAEVEVEAQVLPTPCCRIDCCDGKPECCGAGPSVMAMAVDAAITAPPPAAVGVAFSGNAEAHQARPRPGGGASRKVGGAGN